MQKTIVPQAKARRWGKILAMMTLDNKNWQKEETMFLSGAKFQNFIAMAILVSAVMLGWSAEAAPSKHFGHKLRNASTYITTQTVRNIDGSITCFAINSGYKDICAAFDAYSAIQFPMPVNPVRGTVWRGFPGKSVFAIAWTSPTQKPSAQCKLISARYQSAVGPCP